ncbi:MAG: tripartite tricarboxylate transporter TctB family protein [Spirochaetaceae bacterium]|jgi:putative tricarboxylic transport membrane protein|nr:tripartite tricarboxylate transporter TctB family protein [Spirochaetaceae bacterium]
MKKADIAAGLIGMLFSGAAFTATLGFKQFKNVPIGPEFFPRYLSAGLFLCSAVLFVQALRRADSGKAAALSLKDAGMRRLLAGIAIIALYAFLWDIAGFPVITPAAVFALIFLLGYRKYLSMAVFALGTTAVIFCAFKLLLAIDLPLGFLESLFY